MRWLLAVTVVVVLAAGWVLVRAAGDRAAGERSRRADVPHDVPPKRSARKGSARRPLRKSECPDGLTGCRSARGRVLYVESVDPDGDGDLHVVLAGGGVTGPGITSVDVSATLRPRRDPRIGDQVSTAGQVQRGSFGQSQIHAVEFHVRRG